MTKIAEAVLKVMSQVGYVQKKGVNTFQNYKYASIEGILEKVQPALVDCGLVIVQNEISHEIVAEGNMMEAVYEFTLHHASGETSAPIRQTGLSSLRNSKGGYDDKSLNKCHTTARKYFILGLFQIPTGLADDADAEEDKPEVKAPPPAPRAAKQETVEDKGLAAKAFVAQAVDTLGAFDSLDLLERWLKTWAKHISQLEAKFPDQAGYLKAAIEETKTKFSAEDSK